MKKLVLALFLSLAVAGCATNPLGPLTASTPNPVTRQMMYDVENGLRFAAAGLVTYRRACIAKTIDQNCRQVIARIQTYTVAAKPILVSLRTYLKTNDQINAWSAYSALMDILTSINTVRQQAGV